MPAASCVSESGSKLPQSKALRAHADFPRPLIAVVFKVEALSPPQEIGPI